MNPNDNKYNCACIHRYICMYVHKLEGRERTIFCKRCARYKSIRNDRIGNSTFTTDSGKDHQLVQKPLCQ